jgi:hypothetical protein
MFERFISITCTIGCTLGYKNGILLQRQIRDIYQDFVFFNLIYGCRNSIRSRMNFGKSR